MFPAIFAFLLQAAAAGATEGIPGTGAPTFTVPRAEQDAVIDGRLDEPVWRTAARLTGFSQYQPADGRPADQPTDVLVYYTRTALYFGIVAHVRPGANVTATVSKRDNIQNDDRVIVYLDTFDDRRRAFLFGVNPLGVQLDGVLSEGAGQAGRMFGGGEDFSPDFKYDSRGRLADSAYVVEMRIPFKSLRFPTTARQRWGINIARFTPATNTEDTWVDTKRASASFLAQSGTMIGITDVDRGVVTDVQPFVTSALNGARNDSTGVFSRGSVKNEVGANFRLGYPAVSLDATINPDFSQVESDVGQVTVNERFALFIPEKRPFFLEGIELFSTPNQLVYTRQIVSPVAGAKLAGKFGRFSVAHITAVDNVPGKDALFNVTRLRTDLGGNSIAGITFTDRRVGSDFNTVIAADSRIVFAKLYYFEGQFGQSMTDRGGGRQSSPIYSATLDRTGQLWGFHYNIVGIGPRFESDAGFVPRIDYTQVGIANRLAFYGRDPKKLFQSVWLFYRPNWIWNYNDFGRRSPIEGNNGLNTMINLRGGWRVNASVGRNFYTNDSSLFTGVTVPVPGGFAPYLPTGKIRNLWSGSIEVSTPVLPSIDASVALSTGGVPIFAEGTDGEQQRVDLSLRYRFSAGIRVEALAAYSRITRTFDGSEYASTFIPRIKAEYQPSRSLFFRVISQLTDQRTAALRAAGTTTTLYVGGKPSSPVHTRTLRTDWLISFEPSPGTVAFFGYGNTLEEPQMPGLGRLRRSLDGFFVKLAYQFRR